MDNGAVMSLFFFGGGGGWGALRCLLGRNLNNLMMTIKNEVFSSKRYL